MTTLFGSPKVRATFANTEFERQPFDSQGDSSLWDTLWLGPRKPAISSGPFFPHLARLQRFQNGRKWAETSEIGLITGAIRLPCGCIKLQLKGSAVLTRTYLLCLLLEPLAYRSSGSVTSYCAKPNLLQALTELPLKVWLGWFFLVHCFLGLVIRTARLL